MTKTTAPKFSRTRAGRYHATNGLDILDPGLVSVIITHELLPHAGSKSWVVRAYMGAAGDAVAIDTLCSSLAEARCLGSRVLAADTKLEYQLSQAMRDARRAENDRLDAECDRIRAEYDAKRK